MWFDAPVVVRFVSNAVWIGTDDVLTAIDAPVDWRWCSPTRKPALGCSGIGPQGYDPLVRFNCLLIGQWHPKAGARALNCGWISCRFAASISLHLRPMRRPVAVFAICDDILTGVCRRIGDRGLKWRSSTSHWWVPPPAAISTRRKTGPKRWPPTIRSTIRSTIQACISGPKCRYASAVGQEWLANYAGLQGEIQRLCPPG